MKGKKFIIGNTYVFAFVGDGMVKCIEVRYATAKGKLYGYFDCGIELRLEESVDTEYIHFFNITDSRLNKYINCSLYVFSSLENTQELLPRIIKSNLEEMKSKAEKLMKEYMKLTDDCTTIENSIKSIKKTTFEISKPFE